MAFVPVPNTLAVHMVYTMFSQRVENTLYFTPSAAITPTLMNSLGLMLYNWWVANIRPIQKSDVQLVQMDITSLETEFAPGITYTTNLPQFGTHATGTLMPNNVTLAISFRTAFRGRSYRGRNYFIGFATDQVGASSIVLAVKTSLISAYNALIAAATAAGFTWVVVSRVSHGAPRGTGLATPVTNILIEDTMDSMRRRLPGRGR
jgi:hypothetical protein